MTLLVTHSRVRDFDAWKSFFDQGEEFRRSHGASRHWVYQDVDDPNDVVVALEFPSKDAADAFAADPVLRERMKEAGVEGAPDIHVRDEVEEKRY